MDLEALRLWNISSVKSISHLILGLSDQCIVKIYRVSTNIATKLSHTLKCFLSLFDFIKSPKKCFTQVISCLLDLINLLGM